MRRRVVAVVFFLGATTVGLAGCSSASSPSAASPAASSQSASSPSASSPGVSERSSGPATGSRSGEAPAAGGTGPTAGGPAGSGPAAPAQGDLTDDQPGVTLPARWPADLPRPDGALLQQSSASTDTGAGGTRASAGGTQLANDAATGLPPGDWALFVVPQGHAADVGPAYAAKLRGSGLDVDQRTVTGDGQQILELRVSTDPVAVVRFVPVGAGTVVTVSLAPT